MRTAAIMIVLALSAATLGLVLAEPPEAPTPPRGPFGLSMVSTSDGHAVSLDGFYLSEDCGLCHEKQLNDFAGSFHSVAHHDPFYRAFAERAREEAGEEVYAYCTGCHSPAAVVTGLLPGKQEHELPALAKAGITCDVCHLITGGTGTTGPWGEPGNASFTLEPGRTKYGNIAEIVRNPTHEGAKLPYYSSSEYCASCHTIIHPTNGLRIEHTYAEWKKSIYAQKGIQCQHCHMRSVPEAAETARTLIPSTVRGSVLRKGPERDLNPHYFVGGNANADVLTGSEVHAAMAVERLRSAAELGLTVTGQEPLELQVEVVNVGAGHNLPTSLTELRQMWVNLEVLGADGTPVFQSGSLDDAGEIEEEGALVFGSELLDAEGNRTYMPWEGVSFGRKLLVPPKGSVNKVYRIEVSAEAKRPLTAKARLLYRSAPPHVVREVMGEQAFDPKLVVMTEAEVEIE